MAQQKYTYMYIYIYHRLCTAHWFPIDCLLTVLYANKFSHAGYGPGPETGPKELCIVSCSNIHCIHLWLLPLSATALHVHEPLWFWHVIASEQQVKLFFSLWRRMPHWCKAMFSASLAQNAEVPDEWSKWWGHQYFAHCAMNCEAILYVYIHVSDYMTKGHPKGSAGNVYTYICVWTG